MLVISAGISIIRYRGQCFHLINVDLLLHFSREKGEGGCFRLINVDLASRSDINPNPTKTPESNSSLRTLLWSTAEESPTKQLFSYHQVKFAAIPTMSNWLKIMISMKAAKQTSSNLLQMSVNALKMDSVFPVTVTILSGQLPSLMLIFAPLWNNLSVTFLQMATCLPLLEIAWLCLPSSL